MASRKATRGSGAETLSTGQHGKRTNCKAAGAIVALAPLSTLTHLVPGTKQKGARASEYSLRRRTAPTDELSHPPGWHPGAPGGSAAPIDHVKG